MRRRTMLQLAVASAVPSWCLARPLPTLQISTLDGNDPAVTIAELVLRQAYRQLGREIAVQRLPGERSLLHANSGKTDGELYRKPGLELQYPDLIMVPVPLLTFELVVFSRGIDFPVTGWDSLRPYTIGFVRGNKIAQENTVGMRVEPVSTLELAFGKLAKGRTDLVLGHRASGMAVVRSRQLKDVKALEPPLASFPVYHYLNKRHAALVPELTRVLKQMQADKAIDKIQRRVTAG